MRFRFPPQVVAFAVSALLTLFFVGLPLIMLAGCITPEHEPADLAKAVAAAKPVEKVFTPEFGAMTAIDEIVKLRAHVDALARRPAKCDCECGKHAYAKARDSPSPFPAIVWRVDPLNVANLQYGYEAGGLFYVLTTMRANQ